MRRRILRDYIFKLLFQFQLQVQDHAEQLSDYLVACADEGCTKTDLSYIRDMIIGLWSKVPDIDDCIEKRLDGWTLDRISNVDLSILRLAIYEIAATNTPVNVVISEAVLLAKLYSDESSRIFINGLLGRLTPEQIRLELAISPVIASQGETELDADADAIDEADVEQDHGADT